MFVYFLEDQVVLCRFYIEVSDKHIDGNYSVSL